MSLTNRIVLSVLCLLLVAYLGVLGASLFRTHQSRQAAAAPAPPAEEQVVEEEETEADAAPNEPVGPTAEELASRDAAQVRDAIRRLKAALSAVRRAETQRERGNMERARSLLEAAVADSPHVVELRMALADLAYVEGEFAEARDHLLAALDADPARDPARLLLARTYQAMRHHQAAVRMADWLLEDDQFLEEPNQIAALAYMAMNDAQQAVPYFRRQVAVNRDNIVARNNLAVAYSRLGNFDEAIRLFRAVLQADPGNAITYYNLAVSYAKTDNVDRVVETLKAANERFGPSFVQSWLLSREFDGVRETPAFAALQRAVDEGT